ncbi:hypothetical protein [uncultured Sulfitobacter sp.]|uniref:hypothetical protein n=1 Tax=uncultured Sulfitobacter sp. TaxID=191468 RepID=UPI00262FEFC7|nr:hypothetical protein [uncultured Sulfitobacter sp.]
MLLRSAMIIVLTAGAVAATPLADMDGTWRGAGWAKETVQGQKETVRCQIRNTYDYASGTLTLAGQCVVPGRRLNMSGMLQGSDTSEKIVGRWSNPDGIGSVRITGIQKEGIVAFTFSAKDPETGRDVAQNVEWRVSDGTLRLRSTDRKSPDIMLSDISFEQ